MNSSQPIGIIELLEGPFSPAHWERLVSSPDRSSLREASYPVHEATVHEATLTADLHRLDGELHAIYVAWTARIAR